MKKKPLQKDPDRKATIKYTLTFSGNSFGNLGKNVFFLQKGGEQ